MAKRRQSLIDVRDLTAAETLPISLTTVLGAGRLLTRGLDLIMAKRRDPLVGRITALYALYVLVPAILRTGGFLMGIKIQVVGGTYSLRFDLTAVPAPPLHEALDLAGRLPYRIPFAPGMIMSLLATRSKPDNANHKHQKYGQLYGNSSVFHGWSSPYTTRSYLTLHVDHIASLYRRSTQKNTVILYHIP